MGELAGDEGLAVDGDEASKSRKNKNDRKPSPAKLLKKHTELARAGLAIKPSNKSRQTIKVKKPGKF